MKAVDPKRVAHRLMGYKPSCINCRHLRVCRRYPEPTVCTATGKKEPPNNHWCSMYERSRKESGL